MAFDNIIGQKRVKSFFQKAMDHGRIAHAYLFIGEKGVGKEALAVEFAKGLLCSNGLSCTKHDCEDCSRISKLSHPDLVFVFPAPAKMSNEDRVRIMESIVANPYSRLEVWANPLISIERIREFRRTSAYKSFEGRGRVLIIADCERLTTEASNALLKILEEPPEKTYLIMVSSKPNLLLPTIMSRCQEVKFDSLTFDEIEQALQERTAADKNQARLTARMCRGSYGRALQLLDENLQELQDQALDFFRKGIQNQVIQIQFVEELINRYQRDSAKIKELLRMVVNWFRDAMIFVETDGEQKDALINIEQVEVFRNFAKNFPNADLYSSIFELEKSLQQIERNAHINLVLIVLLNKLRRHLTAKATPKQD
ncbi:MAG: DNA polymerase III subunit delta' [bacterium]